ncbi:MAG: hypothetical protein GSR78_04375 [Desulfurococcales archaeon]|nr:hypothetical protein [Desulfurococcales archaeon]
MAQEVFRLNLLPEEAFGRRLQYAFLSMAYEGSADARVRVYYDRGYADFDSVEGYVRVVREALSRIVSSLKRENRSGCPVPPVGGVDCCMLDRGPSLYTSGASDLKLLREAGFTRCPYITAKGEESVSWVHAAVSYALRVMEEGPLGGRAEHGIPGLAKVTVFSSVRGSGVRREAKNIRVDLDALGTVLLGGALAYLGSHRMSESGGDRLEFLLVPDRPGFEYKVFRDIASADGLGGNLAARAAMLVSGLGVGVEQALSVSLAILLNKHRDMLRGVGVEDRVVGSARLYTVSSGQRPMLRGGLPLSTVVYKAYSWSLLGRLAEAASYARRIRGGDKARAFSSALAECMNDMFLQASAPCHTSFLADCARLLSQVSHDEGLPSEARERAAGLLEAVSRDYESLTGGCGVA